MYYKERQQRTDFDFDGDDEIHKLKRCEKVGSKTIERLQKSNEYNTISDIRDADMECLADVLDNINYADALWIRTQAIYSEGDNL